MQARAFMCLCILGLAALFLAHTLLNDKNWLPSGTSSIDTRGPSERQFSVWDGSHINLEAQIRESMHDPDSFEHIETTYVDKGTHLIVRTVFRGKNAFGGTVRNQVTAKVDHSGNIIEILDSGR